MFEGLWSLVHTHAASEAGTSRKKFWARKVYQMVFGESAFFAQEPIGCAINDKWNFRHGSGVQTEPTRGRRGTSHSLGDTIGMRRNTRAWVLHVGFAEPRCEGVDNHVQVKLWAVHDSH